MGNSAAERTRHYKYIVSLNLVPPSPSVCHVDRSRAIALADPKTRFFGNEVALLVDESDLGNEEHADLALPGVACDNPFDEKSANVGLAAACVECCYDVPVLCTREDFLLIPSRDESFG